MQKTRYSPYLLREDIHLYIRGINSKIIRHPGRDSACRSDCVSFARNFCNQYEHLLVIFDHEGSGGESQEPATLETELESQLSSNGWRDDNSAVIIIKPELEAWVWTDSTELDHVCGWNGRNPDLRQWLVNEGHMRAYMSKPSDPKHAFHEVLKNATPRKRVSASIFRELAARVGFQNCSDRAFVKLKT